MHLLLLAHAGVTWALVGLIWTIQVVHYPMFDRVDPRSFRAFHEQHTRRITLLVGVLMPVEAGLAVVLAWRTPSLLTWLGLGLVVFLWLTTAFLAVPRHAALSRGYDAAVHRALLRANWIRTFGWTARGLLALVLLA